VAGTSPPQMQPKILNGVLDAIQMWNSKDDASPSPGPYKTPYFLELDQLGQRGVPDILVTRQSECPVGSGGSGAGYACSDFPDRDTRNGSLLILTDRNLESGVRPEDMRGRVAHEIGHKFGGFGPGLCPNCIMTGADESTPGQRLHNDVSYHDIRMVNTAF